MAVKAAIKGEVNAGRMAEIIASVANAGGGEVTYHAPVQVVDRIVSEAVRMIAPSLIPVIVPVNGDSIIAIPDSIYKPFMVAGKFPIYRNETIEYLGVGEIERMILERWSATTYDARIIDHLSIEALNLELVERFASRLGDKWPMKLMERLGLTRGGKITVAALLMFGTMPEAYLPQAEIKVNRTKSFVNSEKLTSRSFLGPILDKFDQIVGYISAEAKQIYDIKKFACIEVFLKELIGNAVMHRDYSLPALIDISISMEGITIFSPGVPLKGQYSANGGYMPSIPRNPLLRRTMYFAGIVEPIPGWAMFRQKARECAVDGFRTEIRWGGLYIVLPIGKKVVDVERLNPRQRELYAYLTKHRVITRREYEQMMGISERTARLDLEEMVKSGILKREGRGKQIRYLLNV